MRGKRIKNLLEFYSLKNKFYKANDKELFFYIQKEGYDLSHSEFEKWIKSVGQDETDLYAHLIKMPLSLFGVLGNSFRFVTLFVIVNNHGITISDLHKKLLENKIDTTYPNLLAHVNKLKKNNLVIVKKDLSKNNATRLFINSEVLEAELDKSQAILKLFKQRTTHN